MIKHKTYFVQFTLVCRETVNISDCEDFGIEKLENVPSNQFLCPCALSLLSVALQKFINKNIVRHIFSLVNIISLTYAKKQILTF